MHSLFGVDMPFALQFVLVFVIVLGLIGVTAWAVRWFGAGRLGGAGARGRQPRLGVIDHANVDGRRKLILIRRDNTEHLLMIGGPTDVVVEANIVRAAATARDVATARPAALETLSRAIPLPDNGNGSGSWPLQPEPAAPPAPARPIAKTEAAAEEAPAWPLQPQTDAPPAPPARPQRDTLAALADELSTRPAPPPPPARGRPSGMARAPLEPRVEPRAPAAPSPPPPAAADATPADQSLAEMAHRLEAALRKPGPAAEARPPAPPQRQPSPPAEEAAAPEPLAPPPPPRAGRPAAEPKPARGAAPKPPQSPTVYDNLEQEMASLLGRPTNKS